MKFTNIGVQVFPVLLLAASVMYYSFDAKVMAYSMIVLSILMWSVIFSDSNKPKL